MRRTDSDLLDVPEGALDRLDNDELLRLVVITRDGHRTLADKKQAAWAMLVAKDIERVRGIVSAFRHPDNASVQVQPSEVDRVTQDAYLRLLGMVFRGATIGEYRAAMRSCVRYQCMDDCRREMAQDKRRAGSLDEGVATDDGDSRPKFDKQLARLEQQQIADEEALAHLAERSDDLDRAIAAIEDERKRKVLEMTRSGRPTEEIMAALDTSEANVYQLRRRALELVREKLDGH